MFRFLLALGALTVALFAVLYLLWQQSFISAYPSWWRETLLMMCLITGVVYLYITQPRFSASRDFSLLYLASIAIKLLAGCGYLVVVVLFDPVDAMPNALFFLTCYVLFTAVEVAFMWGHVQSQNGVKKR